MSTKMSTDLNLTRPSSRVIRPPGGASSNIFGTDEEPPKPRARVANSPVKARQEIFPPAPPAEHAKAPAATPAKVAAAAAAAAAAPVEHAAVKAVEGKVTIIVGGNIESALFVEAVVKALAAEGVKSCIQTQLPDVASLPYAAQTLGKAADVIIAGAFLNSTQGDLASSLTNALLQSGLNGKPIVPAFVVQPSLLEAKAFLPDAAAGWAKSAATVLALKSGAITTSAAPEVVIKEKPVHTAAVSSVDTLMDILRESLKARGASGICGLSRKFRIVDDDRSGHIDVKEFTKAISEHSLNWTAAQVKAVFDFFDKDKSGSISFDEFLQGVRGQLNERRKQMVLMAFDILDADKSGVIEVSDITSKYDASKHPDVKAGKRSAESVLAEFLDTFDGEDKDGKVTPAEFANYYSNVSSSIDNDDYFELMIRNAWHISGGEGWCANSSCRRVLVIHTDGRQTVEEIKNDLGVKGEDAEALIAKLVEQGVTDIDTIELNNGTKHKVGEAHAAVAATPSKASGAAGANLSTIHADHHNRASGFNPRRQPGGASTLTLG